MIERYNQPHFEGLSRREVLEMQEPAVLIELRATMLNTYSDLERDIHLVNDVLAGYGVEDEVTQYFDPSLEDGENYVRGEN